MKRNSHNNISLAQKSSLLYTGAKLLHKEEFFADVTKNTHSRYAWSALAVQRRA